jgi:hypothetical protein
METTPIIPIKKSGKIYWDYKTTLKQLYYSFLYPYLTYCITIWGNAPAITLWPILRTQKRAIRIIENIRYRDSTKEAFINLKMLKLPELYKVAVLLFVYKYKNGLLPSPFNNFFTTNNQIHHHATRNAHNFRVPLTKLKMASSFIKKTGVDVWNELTNRLDHQMKIGIFKRSINELLLSSYEVKQ